jgi:hypothetical protein
VSGEGWLIGRRLATSHNRRGNPGEAQVHPNAPAKVSPYAAHLFLALPRLSGSKASIKRYRLLFTPKRARHPPDEPWKA